MKEGEEDRGLKGKVQGVRRIKRKGGSEVRRGAEKMSKSKSKKLKRKQTEDI